MVKDMKKIDNNLDQDEEFHSLLSLIKTLVSKLRR